MNVYVRDMRYVVESANAVLFWLVPIFYSFERIPRIYGGIYELNPLAALVFSLRKILLENKPPEFLTLAKLTGVSALTLLFGAIVFQRCKRDFYDYL